MLWPKTQCSCAHPLCSTNWSAMLQCHLGPTMIHNVCHVKVHNIGIMLQTNSSQKNILSWLNKHFYIHFVCMHCIFYVYPGPQPCVFIKIEGKFASLFFCVIVSVINIFLYFFLHMVYGIYQQPIFLCFVCALWTLSKIHNGFLFIYILYVCT